MGRLTTAHLRRIAESIAQTHPWAPLWEHPESAEGECWSASRVVLEHLTELHIFGEVVLLREVAGPDTYVAEESHWVVRCGEVIVDMTARQFASWLPFPHVWQLPRARP